MAIVKGVKENFVLFFVYFEMNVLFSYEIAYMVFLQYSLLIERIKNYINNFATFPFPSTFDSY